MSIGADLHRFVTAQDDGGTYARALAELRAGRKVTHWMWFVFPQVAGLGHSATAQYFALESLAEARAYLAHDVLGPRLLESATALTELTGRSAPVVFGDVDAVKLRSSMTLFLHADSAEPVFAVVLAKFFDGAEDPATVAILEEQSSGR
ncbi:DUF1810 domain-containing protein [uncultured Jatrophihabitans sp.]|uniref:DUF1810 domain-containing protein n=1 Tax=uncultured Jatrophihabitans sp. TaxID=1610747 RepID=UPI0035CAD2DA